MASLAQVSTALQHVLTEVAEAAAHATGCVQRQRRFTGASWVQTVVFGSLSTPEPTLSALAQTAAALGVSVTPQAIAQRWSEATADCLEQVLAAAVTQVVAADPVAIPLLQRFGGVYLVDTSLLQLPTAVADRWPGCGNGAMPTRAALKLGVGLELQRGTLHGPLVDSGRTHDRTSAIAALPIPAGALRIADLGFWALPDLAALSAAGGLWLSRLQAQTAVCDATGERLGLDALLASTLETELELAVWLGVAQQLPARLLAQRVPAEVAAARRRRLKADAKRRGHGIRQTRLARADWHLLVTNVPADQLTVAEARVLARARWQVELLFKLWKSHGHLDAVRSTQPWRVVGEIYAKLIAMVIQHWTILLGCWHRPARSLPKAAATVRQHALSVALALPSPARLRHALATLATCLAATAPMNPRRTHPNLAQLLLACEDGGLT